METYSSSKTQSWLIWFLRGILILGFLILIGRLLELQIVKGEYFRDLSEGNRIRRVPIIAARGKILARGGEVLVGSREVKKKVVFDPVNGFEKSDDISGASEEDVISEFVRNYEVASDFAHVSGYLGEVNEEEVGKVDPKCKEKGPRKLRSLIGRSGLEQTYNCQLSGFDGEELVEVDSFGNKIRVLGQKNPIPGEDIKTTIHFGLQNYVARIMSGREEVKLEQNINPRTSDGEFRGAVLATDTNGEILALYSSPTYNPNYFVNKSSSSAVNEILNDKDLPLFNRAISGKFPPGSVFKPIVATAALEEGAVDENYTYTDEGVITIKTIYGDFSYSNWYFTQYGGKEGEIGLERALARSTDTFFYKLGELTGIDSLVKWSEKFGLSELSGVDLPGEIGSLVPSPEWKESAKGERWFLGDTYNVSIGQGDLALTPIAMNRAISIIASGGVICNSSLVMDFQNTDHRPLITDHSCLDLGISQNTIDLVKSGMIQVCSAGGTGFTFFDFKDKYGIDVACKTGTAETFDNKDPHSWFVAFDATDEPEIIVTVLIENGGEGSRVAGPVARKIFDYWFGELKNTRDN